MIITGIFSWKFPSSLPEIIKEQKGRGKSQTMFAPRILSVKLGQYKLLMR